MICLYTLQTNKLMYVLFYILLNLFVSVITYIFCVRTSALSSRAPSGRASNKNNFEHIINK